MIALGVLALAGLAAALEPREVMHEGRNEPSFISARDYTNSDAEPCKIISQVFEESKTPKGKAAFLQVPISTGIACLKSVPLDKERDLALLDYLEPLIEFQSTLEVLTDPPEGYLFPGVNVLGGLDTIRDNLNKNKYKGQYEVMTDLRSLFAAANDLHFDYPPALLNTFYYVRRGLDFKSISSDGLNLPQIFHTLDVVRGNEGHLDYYPSAIKSIDGTAIEKWLEEDATRNTNNLNDPDAQFNNLFSNIPRSVTSKTGTALITQFEIPDNYTIKFYNGTELEVVNEIAILKTVDFSGIESGEDFHEYFEIPHNTTSEKSSSNERRADNNNNTTTTKETADLPGYPKPVVKHSKNSLAGYFLEGEGYEKTAVLTILSFLPIGFEFATLGEFDFVEYVAEAEEVLGEFIKKCKKAGRDKLIIDVSANGGGSLALAQSIYRVLFPDGEFTTFDRYRATESLAVATEADYETLLDVLVLKTNEWPIDPKGEPIEEGKKWFGPYTIKGGQNMTAAFQRNLGRFEDDEEDSGNKKTTKVEPPWKPENILIVTDGTCASACTVLTGWLTRNYGIRTVALGGRPLHLAMQAMGGVKGTLLSFHSDFVTATASFLTSVKNDKKALKILQDHEDAFPSLDDPPLLPLTNGADAGKVNSLSGYTDDDVDGYPVHFRYEAANCRLFYTQRMLVDPSESWRHVSAVGWNGAPCVYGSTVNSDGTIGNKTLKYDARVRSRARGVQGPGTLKK